MLANFKYVLCYTSINGFNETALFITLEDLRKFQLTNEVMQTQGVWELGRNLF